MANTNGTTDPALAQTDQENKPANTLENNAVRDPIRKKTARSLHAKRTCAAAIHPRAETESDSAACCEIYSRMDGTYLPLSGQWLPKAGFTRGMPVKIRVMKDCIVITPQHTRELWGCLEGMSVVDINKQKVASWLKTFPGALKDTGDIPVICRNPRDNLVRSC